MRRAPRRPLRRWLAACLLCPLLSAPLQARADHAGPAWIFWSPSWEEEALRAAAGRPLPLAPRALARLARTGADVSAVNPANRPAPQGFLDHLERLGVKPRSVSRLLRAVGAELTEAQWDLLRADSGVVALVPAATYLRPKPTVYDPAPARSEPQAPPAGAGQELGRRFLPPDPRILRRGDYGSSLRQSEQLGVTDLHRLGYSGDGVLVCLLDSGYHTSHTAFANADLVATRDFAGHDSVVSYQPDDPDPVDMETHGTLTWSALGGFEAGSLVGPAYGASFLLARTEVVSSETRTEEFNYVAGCEWADSLGADVISTSLGYRDFDPEQPGDQGFRYSNAEMNGRTAVASRFAGGLAARGILLATAMGNEGRLGTPTSLVSPADADSIVSVGAVDSLGRLAFFSSRGPTADGRIKPDVCADGVRVFCAFRSGDEAYGHADGTSLATPLIGGLAALLRQARPEWSPLRIIRAMRRAGDQADQPDNDRGYGLPDALTALDADTTADPAAEVVGWFDLRTRAPGDLPDSIASPGDSGLVVLELQNLGPQATRPSWVSLIGFPEEADAAVDSARVESIPPGGRARVAEGLAVGLGDSASVPLPLLVRIAGEDGTVYYRRALLESRPAPAVAQLQPYPNPLRSGETLTLDLALPAPATIDVRVYNVAGRLVEQPFRRLAVGPSQSLRYTPGAHLRSGVYFLRIDGIPASGTRRFLLVR